MLKRAFATFWKEMHLDHKVNVLGCALMIISLFFPWYSDLDNYLIGDVYAGLNGPLYFAGFTLLLSAFASLALSVAVSAKDERLFQRFKKRSWTQHQFGLGLFAFYLLFMVNSAYFHPKFGFNITLKESGFGVLLALIAAGLMTVGGFFAMKSQPASVSKMAAEPLKEVAPEVIQTPKVTQPALSQIRKPLHGFQGSNATSYAPSTGRMASSTQKVPMPRQTGEIIKPALPTEPLRPQSKIPEQPSSSKPQAYRMDL